MASQTISHYRIISKLGAGGMGEVYLAEDTRLNRKVAIKLLPTESTADEQSRKRLLREAQAAATLDHPNICAVHEVGEEDGRSFIVMQHVEGETLSSRIQRKPLELRESLEIAVQIADALSEAHSQGIIHRDIKPQNIMITVRGQAKVMDFGLARVIRQPQALESEAETTTLLTEPGAIVGTVPYMSPEQVRGEALEGRSDIFSFGAVLYQMITAQQPFAAESAAATISAILTHDPAPLARYAREAPAELERIVAKALTKDREERYQTAKDLLIDLKRLKQRLEVEAEIERSAFPETPSAVEPSPAGRAPEASDTEHGSAASTGASEEHPVSSGDYVVSEIKRHKRGALLALAALVAVTAAVAYFGYSRYRGGSGAGTIRSLAVLPFENKSNDPDTEYLSDGISESLINSLSQLPGVKVIARSSSFSYKGKEVDPQEVANALGVEAILTGRVVKRGDNLLISAELVNAIDKTQVWGEQYNRKAADLLQVQAEISKEIAERLRLRLTAVEQHQLAKGETVNPQAYELLLKGRFYWRKGGTDNQRKAVEYYQQAIALDPNYSLAYAELSASYSNLIHNSSLDPKEFTPKAEWAVLKALALDETLADAHLALANFKVNAWDWAAAEQEYRRAIELNPNLAEAYRWYSVYLSFIGRYEQAIAEIKRARELDPLSLPVSADVGWTLLNARQYDEAIAAVKKTLELDQNFPRAHNYLGYIYAAKGMYAEAIAAYQETIRLGEQSPSIQIYLGAAYARSGAREKAQAILKRLQTSKEYVSPGELAILYGSLGEREQAFASLEKAYATHDLQLQYLGVDPALDSLRSDPRFKDLMHRVGLPQ